MAYEYENDVVSALISGGMHYNSNAHYEMADEVEEVYAKAKAWDNYLAEVERDIRNISDNEDEIKWHVDYVINEYMEDE